MHGQQNIKKKKEIYEYIWTHFAAPNAMSVW